MRIIAHSDDCTWTTGFGSQLHQILYLLKKARPEWELAALHWGHRGPPIPTAFGYNWLPDGGRGHFDNAKAFIDRFQPDLYLTLYDLFVSGPFMCAPLNDVREGRTVQFPGLSHKAG